MSHTEFLGINPLELQFPFELKKQISCSLQLTNKTGDYVAFKVKTTSPKKYCVRPNNGIVPPRSSADVLVTMQAQREAPPDMQCKDKFLVQSFVVSEDTAAKDLTGEMFTKDSRNLVDEVKLKVVYVPMPQLPSPVLEGSEEVSPPRQSESVVGNSSYQELSSATTEHVEPQIFSATRAHKEREETTSEAKSLILRLTEEKNYAIQQNHKLQKDMDILRREISKQQGGFSLVFVVIVALLGIMLGFIMKR